MLSLVYWLDVYLIKSAVVFGGEQEHMFCNVISVKNFRGFQTIISNHSKLLMCSVVFCVSCYTNTPYKAY